MIRRNTERFMKFKTTKGFHKVNNVKEVYNFEKELGAGQFGKVYKARNILTEMPCAIKVISKRKVNER